MISLFPNPYLSHSPSLDISPSPFTIPQVGWMGYHAPNNMKPGNQRDVRWIEGLRGITALFIVTGHLFGSLDSELQSPARTRHGLPSFFQLPIIRLVISGRASLSIFFLLTGFVNSLSFIKQARAGNQLVALSGLSKSALRRFSRMMFPAAAATVVSWILCNLGAYRLASQGEVTWFRDISPSPKRPLSHAIWDLVRNLWTTWAISSNEYDKVQWNLFFLLKASLTVYMILLMTAYITSRARKVVLFIYYIYGWMGGDVLVIMNASAGIFLVELFYDHLQDQAAAASDTDAEIPIIESPSSSSSISSSGHLPLLPTLILLSGMIIAGFPEKNADWCFWSQSLSAVGTKLFGPAADFSRHWSSIGTSMILFGLLYLPTAQSLLSHPLFVWMGKVSFSVFLIHSMLIRSLFCWMLYYAKSSVPPADEKMVGIDNDKREEKKNWNNLHNGSIGGKSLLPPATGINLFVTYLIFFPLLYLSAHLWMHYIESRSTDLGRWLENRMGGDGQQDIRRVLLLPK